ncbi:Protein-tyrosine-phosphatase MKP1 [Glycine max]|nr:Protein-tyrosine-phosphatase MKP1 [Glycine max]
MVGNDDAGHLSASRKMFWRSASWSSSRTAAGNASSGEAEKGFADSGAADGPHVQNRRFGPPPLTPRSQQNCKARSCLPPLQPLSIARRSLDEWPKAGSDDIGEWPQPPTTPGGRVNGSNGERLKLDLSSIQHNNPDHSRSNNGNGLVKRDRIAFFDKECSKVADHVYLGGDAVARDRDILKHNGITHVLNCVGFVCPEYFKADFVYRTLWLQDSPSEDITSILYDVFDYFEDVREQGGRVFVHCCQGVSRSTSLVIAYLMWREGQSFDDAFQFVKAARGIADPNMGFACQLLQCQKRVHAVPLSPSSLLRMYRIAPHSPYDPLHLVPKMLTDPSLAALDSRGAFIVHIPSAIYVWIGKDCEAIMERDARGAVGQIVRYEKVQGPNVMIKEGEEPVSFWDAFSSFLPLMDKDKSGNRVEDGKRLTSKVLPGERRVDSYNVDYEVFKKAITGGFVPPFASSGEHETHLPARESSWSVRVSYAGTKEFVSAPRLSFPRVYSDSMLCIYTSNANLSPSSSLSSSSSSVSSSSSPSYVSPDSISSDSSPHSKSLSEVSPDSSSIVLTSIPVSSCLSNFSNLSITSYSSTSKTVSNSTDVLGVKLSHPWSQSASLPLKKSSTSLAERRGNLSKFLKLPLMNDKTQVTDKSSTSHASREYDILVNGNVSYLQQSDNKDYFCKSNNHAKDGGVNSIQKCELALCPSIAGSMDLKEFSQSTALKGTNESGLLQCNVAQTWVHLDIDKQTDYVRDVDWNQIGCDLLAQFSLPKNTVMKEVAQCQVNCSIG